MTCQSDIENVAAQKILDAECLLLGGRFDGAYYLAGYAIELLLKAKICKTLGIADFFDFDNKDRSVKIKNDNSVFRTHNYEQLLILSGIYIWITKMNKTLNSKRIGRSLQNGMKIVVI